MKRFLEYTDWNGKVCHIAIDWIGQIEPEKVEGKDYSWIVTKTNKQIRTKHTVLELFRAIDTCQ